MSKETTIIELTPEEVLGLRIFLSYREVGVDAFLNTIATQFLDKLGGYLADYDIDDPLVKKWYEWYESHEYCEECDQWPNKEEMAEPGLCQKCKRLMDYAPDMES